MDTQVETQYVYLLQTREFLNLNEPVYKIGRSKQDNLSRFSQYTLGSVLLYQSSCYDNIKLEKEIIALFKQKYIHKKTLGREWFKGDPDEMIIDFCDIVKNSLITRKVKNNVLRSIRDAFVDRNIQDVVVVEEHTQDIDVVEEHTQDIDVVEEHTQDIDVVEEHTQDIDVVEKEDYYCCVLLDDVVVVENDVVVEDDVEDDDVEDDDVEDDDVEDDDVEDDDVEDEVEGSNNSFREKKFICMTCEYGTNVKSNLKKHCLTNKHLLQVSPETGVPSIITYNCHCKVCNKGYKSQSGLWKHSQVCKAPEVIVPIAPEVVVPIAPDEVGLLHKKIDNLERIILEMAKK
jgi:hypothetical protein